MSIYHQQYASAGGRIRGRDRRRPEGNANPVAYFAGGTVALLKEDYDPRVAIEWKQDIPNPFNADNLPQRLPAHVRVIARPDGRHP